MNFSNNKRHQAKINPITDGTEDIFSLNMHAQGPGELAESEWQTAGLVAPNMTALRE